MEALVTRYRAVALTELLAAYRGEEELPPRSVLITFDDAYRDFRDNAWPVLRELAIPATLFVPTGFPGHLQRAFWWDRLWQAIVGAQATLPVQTALGRIELGDEQERRRAARVLIEYHKTLEHTEALDSVEQICEQLGAPSAQSEVLDWGELRDLATQGVALASHSRTHPLLTRLPSEAVAAEVEGSRRDLEAEVPRCGYGNVFAYPGGAHDDRTVGMLSQLGFGLAFTTIRGMNRLGHTDRLRLRRINVGSRAHAQLIRAQIAMSTLRYRTIGR